MTSGLGTGKSITFLQCTYRVQPLSIITYIQPSAPSLHPLLSVFSSWKNDHVFLQCTLGSFFACWRHYFGIGRVNLRGDAVHVSGKRRELDASAVHAGYRIQSSRIGWGPFCVEHILEQLASLRMDHAAPCSGF